MNKPSFVSLKILILAIIGHQAFISCSSDVDVLPPPPPVNPSSASEQVWSYCIYPDVQQCYQGSYSTCPGGGELSNDCPFTEPSSSSLGNSAAASSSSGNVRSSSSDAVLEFDYCVFATEKLCLNGPVSACPPGGVLRNDCPYSSSSSVAAVVVSSSSSLGGGGNSSSSVQQVSSSSSVAAVVVSSSSSLGGGGGSESQELGSFDGTYFTDPRDGKKYEYEIKNERIWMNENLNYSRGNTLGWCYVTGGTALGEAGADLSGCNSPYGRTYTWSIATDGNLPRGLCPKGWHIPSRAEWQAIGVGTTEDATGSRPMSNGFYVKAGNYNKNPDYPPLGWKKRGDEGYWWTSDPNRYFIYLSTSPAKINTKSSATVDDYFSVRCVADVGAFNFKPELTGACQWDKNPTSTARGAKPGGVTIVDLDKVCTSPTVVYKYADGTKTWPASGIINSGTYSDVTPILNCPAYGTTVTLPSCPPLEVRDGADYIIDCKGNYANLEFCEVNGKTGNSVTLKDGECVEINVLGYTNQSDLPEVGMRCNADNNLSFTVSLNRKESTINGNGFISLGNIKVGDNEFGTLCLKGGAPSIRCTGPSQ